MFDHQNVENVPVQSRIETLEAEVAALRVVAFHILSQAGTVTSSRVMACLRGDVLDQRTNGDPAMAPVLDAVQSLVDQVMDYDKVES